MSGQRDEAFKWLTKAREERVFELIAMRVDPRFDPLCTDSRFDTIVGQIGFD
jgi:hypothetical protein